MNRWCVPLTEGPIEWLSMITSTATYPCHLPHCGIQVPFMFVVRTRQFISHLCGHPESERRGVTVLVLVQMEFLVEMMSRTHAGGFALVLSGCIRTGSTGFRVGKAGSLIKETDSTQWLVWLFCLNVPFVMVRTGNKRPEIPMRKNPGGFGHFNNQLGLQLYKPSFQTC